jgi:hypothetical protein
MRHERTISDVPLHHSGAQILIVTQRFSFGYSNSRKKAAGIAGGFDQKQTRS